MCHYDPNSCGRIIEESLLTHESASDAKKRSEVNDGKSLQNRFDDYVHFVCKNGSKAEPYKVKPPDDGVVATFGRQTNNCVSAIVRVALV